ncbi:Rieske 2Fe-2S domain-containing protein [Roseobacter weihaiensis]|uniref:Rieske 2Fe-2S domain-containing protein n=1 Tax=Roseobacter weihaiensis TaxID=2763262 RepID=UPI001D0AA554|nr:Rieske (2Fe-2S) protein [Roseobacter sp. H9]
MDWIAVGLSVDVPAGTVVPRRVNDTDMAIWCSAAGKLHAWGDRCPHRGMRLSHGFVRGETLSCIYHGWQYGMDGTCSYIPAHPQLEPPKTICARSYACNEQDQMIWVALAPTQAKTPDAEGRRPVRSLEITLPVAKVAEGLGHPMSSLMVLGGVYDLAVALQPSTQHSCVLHAFAGADQERKQVSRHLEKMRAELESADA